MWCGSKPQAGTEGEAADRLEMWRAYGDDGKGVALTLWWDNDEVRKEGLEIIEVDYLSKDEFETTSKKIKDLYEEQRDEDRDREEREEIRRKRMRLGALHKLKDYEGEQEFAWSVFWETRAAQCAGLVARNSTWMQRTDA